MSGLGTALKLSQGLGAEARLTIQRVEEAVQSDPVPGLLALAQAQNVSQREMSLSIRAASGAPYSHLRIAHRIRPSMELLLRGDEQVAQVAYRIGYEYPGQFDRDFKLIIGLTPTAFRCRLRQV